MNIVVLDGYTLNEGDLSWDGLAALGELKVYDRTPPELAAERAADAEIVLTNKTPLGKEMIDRLPKLQYIGVLATGYDVVDVRAAAERGITVTNIPAYGTASVAQFVFALLLELCNRVALHSESARRGEWATSPDWCYRLSPLVELSGKTMGLIGFGRIAQQTARVALAFGMRVVASSRSTDRPPAVEGVRWADRAELLRTADVVSLHCPLTPETERLIDREALALMKPTAMLINTARGRLIDEEALAEALRAGRLAGAALDVLTVEPPADSPLLSAPRCVVTPHIAWATREARGRLLDMAVDNVRAFLNGEPVHVVSRNF